MPQKKVKYDFWKIEVPESFEGGFLQALTNLRQIQNVSDRNIQIDGDVVRWEHLDLSDPRYVFGDFGKLRMQVLPKKGGIDQLSSSLALTNSEGVDELFAFLYDSQSNILVAQVNHYGASIGAFQKYLLEKIRFGGPIHILPVLSQDGVEKLNSINDVRKLVYKIARPTTQELNPIANAGFDTAMSQLNKYGAYTVESTISMDRKKSSMLVSAVQRLYENLTSDNAGNVEVEKFEISGYINESKEKFDLISDRLRYEENLDVSADRSIPFVNRRNAALRALDAKRNELIAQFGDECR